MASKFADDMGVHRCHECDCKVYRDGFYYDGKLYCTYCAENIIIPDMTLKQVREYITSLNGNIPEVLETYLEDLWK